MTLGLPCQPRGFCYSNLLFNNQLIWLVVYHNHINTFCYLISCRLACNAACNLLSVESEHLNILSDCILYYDAAVASHNLHVRCLQVSDTGCYRYSVRQV